MATGTAYLALGTTEEQKRREGAGQKPPKPQLLLKYRALAQTCRPPSLLHFLLITIYSISAPQEIFYPLS